MQSPPPNSTSEKLILNFPSFLSNLTFQKLLALPQFNPNPLPLAGPTISFGFALGGVIAVAELAWKLYHFCFVVARGAPHEFQLLLQEITSLSQSVQLLQLGAKNPNSTLMSSRPDRIQMVGEIMCRVKETLTTLEKVATKYKKLGDTKCAKRELIWEELKWSSEAETVESLRDKVRVCLCL